MHARIQRRDCLLGSMRFQTDSWVIRARKTHGLKVALLCDSKPDLRGFPVRCHHRGQVLCLHMLCTLFDYLTRNQCFMFTGSD